MKGLKPASHPGSLASVFLRQTASTEGRQRAFVTLGKLLPRSYTEQSLKTAERFRSSIRDARKFVLGGEFVHLADKLIADAGKDSARLKPLWQFGVPLFDPMWIEFLDYGEERDQGMQTGLLIDSAQSLEETIRFRMVFKERGGVCVAPPIGVISAMHRGGFRDGEVDSHDDDVRGIMADAHFNEGFHWIASHVRPMVAHSGGLAFKLAADRLSRKDPRWNDQGRRAWSIAANGFFTGITFLGLLALSPVRHVVGTRELPPGSDDPREAWMWKHDHKVVELTRPLTVREVHLHVQERGKGRSSPAMHDVMGFWRVTGGDPHCDHAWRDEPREVGTDTELGRPHRDPEGRSITRYRCGRCSALRSWVKAHTRGDATRGVVSKEFTVEAPKG